MNYKDNFMALPFSDIIDTLEKLPKILYNCEVVVKFKPKYVSVNIKGDTEENTIIAHSDDYSTLREASCDSLGKFIEQCDAIDLLWIAKKGI